MAVSSQTENRERVPQVIPPIKVWHPFFSNRTTLMRRENPSSVLRAIRERKRGIDRTHANTVKESEEQEPTPLQSSAGNNGEDYRWSEGKWQKLAARPTLFLLIQPEFLVSGKRKSFIFRTFMIHPR
jgi:hypothetical protein